MLLFGIVWALAAGNTPNWLAASRESGPGRVAGDSIRDSIPYQLFSIWWYDRSTKAIAHMIEQEIRRETAWFSFDRRHAGFISRRLNTIACMIVLRR